MIPKIVAKIRSKYVNGASKDASDFLKAMMKEKCPRPPSMPNTENRPTSIIAIGLKKGIRIIDEITVPTKDE